MLALLASLVAIMISAYALMVQRRLGHETPRRH